MGKGERKGDSRAESGDRESARWGNAKPCSGEGPSSCERGEGCHAAANPRFRGTELEERRSLLIFLCRSEGFYLVLNVALNVLRTSRFMPREYSSLRAEMSLLV